MFGSFANTFSLSQLAYNLFVLSTGLLIRAKVSCVHEEGYKTPFMKYNFFLHTVQLFFRMLYFVLLYNSAAFEKVRCENQLFFVKRKRISRTETRSTLPGQSVSQNLVSGGDKENGSDQMVQKMHSCALVVPPPLHLGAESSLWSLWSAVHVAPTIVTQFSFQGGDEGVHLWEKTERQGYYFS